MPSHLNEPFLRFVRYNVVNVITFALDLAIIFILTQFLHVFYLISVVIGFICEVVTMFLINRKWTFGKDVALTRMGYTALVASVSLIIITTITYVGVHFFDLYYLLARLFAGAFAALWSYFGDSHFTFNVPPLSSSAPEIETNRAL
ncbi:MAG: GtrA family protein [Candidatus Kaiserbacteria bacterium]|nr:GtrA family protein [Candidatus Kaiserbacteria bacterium]